LAYSVGSLATTLTGQVVAGFTAFFCVDRLYLEPRLRGCGRISKLASPSKVVWKRLGRTFRALTRLEAKSASAGKRYVTRQGVPQ